MPEAPSAGSLRLSDLEAGRDLNITLYQGAGFPRPDYLRDASALLTFYRERFVAREQELGWIAAQVSGPEPGYVLVEAPGGFGKSALMAQVVDRVLDGRWPVPAPALACFFIRADGARNTAVAFLQAVNAQLLDQLGIPGGTPPGVVELQGQLSQLWSEAVRRAGPAAPVLLVVDGLDEMDDDGVTIADVLPSGLGPNVHVVTSSRVVPDARELVGREHPLRVAQALDLQAFGEDSVRLVMERYGLEGIDDGAARILMLTRGEPLFVRFVCEEVTRRGAAELDRLEKAPPADAEDYFREQLQRLGEAELGDVSWELLGALVVAHGGMTEDELAAALGQPRRVLREAIKPVRRFLLGDERFDLFHRSLSDLVAGEFTPAELDGLRGRLAAWCRSYGERGWPAETPRYVLDHCAQHYAESDPAAVLALPDREWLTRQREATGSVGGFIRDVETALAVAAAREDVLAEARLCLIGATARSVATNVPAVAIGVLARCGAVAEARACAELTQSETGRATALAELGAGLAAGGDAAGARTAFAGAIEELAAAQYKFDDFVPAVVALADAVAGDARLPARLLEVARMAEWAAERATCVGAVAARLEDGRAVLERAVEETEAAEDDALAGDALAAYALAAGRVGARALLERLERRAEAGGELAAVAEGWARAGDAGRASGLVGRIADDDAAEAVVVLEHPDLRAARAQLAGRIPARGSEGRAALIFGPEADVRAFAATGNAAALEALVAATPDEDDGTLGEAAVGFATLGDAGRALACLRRMPLGDGSMIDADVPRVAAALAGQGLLDGALEAGDAAVYPAARARAIAFVARALLDAGDADRALAEARRAVQVGEALEDHGGEAAAFAALAGWFADRGDAAAAADCTERARVLIEGTLPGARSSGWTRPVVRALVRAGRLDDALALADGEYPDFTLIGEIAVAHAEGGDAAQATVLVDRALAAAENTFRTESDRVLRAAARALRALGDDARADECEARAARHQPDDEDADVEPSPRERAEALAAAGRAEEAAQAAREALAAPDDDIAASPTSPVEMAKLLPAAEGAAVLRRLAAEAPESGHPYGRAELRAAIAAALHEHDPAAAGAVLRDAFLTARLGGRAACMRVVALGPLADLHSELPARLAAWMPEVEAWWESG